MTMRVLKAICLYTTAVAIGFTGVLPIAAVADNAILGLMYNKGKIGNIDDAYQGDAIEQYNLARYYYSNPETKAKAYEWYQKAANQGIAKAQYNLGVMYSNGESVPQDYAKAHEWYQKAADQGLSAAQDMLEINYFNGERVHLNDPKTHELYQKAANQGDAKAQYKLGFMYSEGEGVPRDYAKAREWYQKACDNGDERGCNVSERLDRIYDLDPIFDL